MNRENREHAPGFIPCGDALEKMTEEISEQELEMVSGGARMKRDGICSVCGGNAYNRNADGGIRLVCACCGHME